MAELVTVEDIHFASSPSSASRVLKRGDSLAMQLEEGNILHIPSLPLYFSREQEEFLLSFKRGFFSQNKDIIFSPRTGKIANFSRFSIEKSNELSLILWKFSQYSLTLLSKLLTPYSSKWHLSSVCFFCHHDQDKKKKKAPIHLDFFPHVPLYGDRILHFFVNMHPQRSVTWTTSSSFAELLEIFGEEAVQNCSLFNRNHFSLKVERLMKRCCYPFGNSSPSSSHFDCFIKSMHKNMSRDKEFQKNVKKQTWTFPPHSCWLAFTDSLAHSYMNEGDIFAQSFVIPKSAMKEIEKAPISRYAMLKKKIAFERDYECVK